MKYLKIILRNKLDVCHDVDYVQKNEFRLPETITDLQLFSNKQFIRSAITYSFAFGLIYIFGANGKNKNIKKEDSSIEFRNEANN